MNHLPCHNPLSAEQLRIAYKTITTFWRWKDWEIEDTLLWDRFARLREPTLGDLIQATYELSSGRSGKPRWGDKTPEYVREIDRLHAVFPKAQFIHIIRDARDVCSSLELNQFRGSGSFRHNARYWADYVSAGIEAGRDLPSNLYTEIAYEDLVLRLEHTLRRVCQFLGVDYESNMLNFYKYAEQNVAPWEQWLHRKTTRPPRPEDAYRWKKEIKVLDLLTVEAIAGDVMKRVNQPRRFSGLFRVVPLGFLMLDLSIERMLSMSRRIRRRLHQTEGTS
jgi:hypothetical protein